MKFRLRTLKEDKSKITPADRDWAAETGEELAHRINAGESIETVLHDAVRQTSARVKANRVDRQKEGKA